MPARPFRRLHRVGIQEPRAGIAHHGACRRSREAVVCTDAGAILDIEGIIRPMILGVAVADVKYSITGVRAARQSWRRIVGLVSVFRDR